MPDSTLKVLVQTHRRVLIRRFVGEAGAFQAEIADISEGPIPDAPELIKRAADRFESYAAARLENQGLGKMRVLRDLRQRRVAPQLAEQVTAKTYQDTDEGALIEEFLKKKYRGKKLGEFLGEEKNLAAAYRRLRYAGFAAGASIRVLKRYAQQAEELESLEMEEPLEPEA